MTQYYVATTGSDSNPGTEILPWRSIQKAADTLQPGDTVYVREGTYTGSVNLTRSGTANNYITLVAYPGENPVLEPGNWVGFTDYNANQVSWFIIDGFEIRGFEFGIYLAHSSNFILRNNNVHHNSAAAINIGGSNNGIIAYNVTHDSGKYNGIWADQSAELDIHHNVSYSNFQNGIAISHESNNNLIHHNAVYSNSCGSDRRYAGIAIEVNSQNNRVYDNIMYANCHAGFLTNSPNNEIYHNVMYGNDDAQVSMGPWEGSKPEGNILKNNIFFVTRSTDKAVQFWSYQTPYDPLANIFDYNLYYYVNGPDKSDMCYDLQRNYSFAQWQTIAGKEQHGLLGNPQFVDPDNNFHLMPSSPAIDAGANVGVVEDFDGTRRPQGAGYDIGAYEYKTQEGQMTTLHNGESFKFASLQAGTYNVTAAVPGGWKLDKIECDSPTTSIPNGVQIKLDSANPGCMFFFKKVVALGSITVGVTADPADSQAFEITLTKIS